MSVRPGTRLNGRYEAIKPLGQGGMGVVWQGHDILLQRDVAIKVMMVTDPDEVSFERFVREAQVGAGLTHPGITEVHDIGRSGDDWFIVMELLSGRDLQTLLSTHKHGLAAERAVNLMVQASEALAVAHQRGVVHRDLKPQNVFVQTGDRLKICDFGLARVLNAPHITNPGKTMGTPAYMAPEQFRSAAVDARADVYSLGCVLYALLTGHPPFPPELSWPALYAHHQSTIPEPPRGAHPVPRELSKLVLWMLAKDSKDRPSSALTVASDLRKIDLKPAPKPAPKPQPQPAPKPQPAPRPAVRPQPAPPKPQPAPKPATPPIKKWWES